MGSPDRRCGIWFDRLTDWRDELLALRAILLDTPLEEAFKWRSPVYRVEGRNVAALWGLKADCGLAFFKGVLLEDPDQRLTAPGANSRSVRKLNFTSTEEVARQEAVIRGFIAQAIAAEQAGLKVQLVPDDLPLPEELSAALSADPALRAAFAALTPGRRRGYVLHISAAKQSQTRRRRIEKWRPLILQGKGLHDR